MSIKKTLLMLSLNYILIFAWMFLYRLGYFSALVIFPASMLIAFFDTYLAEGRKSALIWCGNLLIANIAGILLQNFIYYRETLDLDTAVLRSAIEIPVAILMIGITSAVSGHFARKKGRKRRGAEEAAEGRRFSGGSSFNEAFSGGRVMSLSSGDDDDFDDTDPDEDEEDTFEEEPKFRVIKKS